MVIVGGSVTSLLVAQSNSIHRAASSKRQLTAQHLAKELIATWSLEEASLEVAARGSVPDQEHWAWRRTVEEIDVSQGVSAQQVSLVMIYAPTDRRKKPWSRTFYWLDDESRTR